MPGGRGRERERETRVNDDPPRIANRNEIFGGGRPKFNFSDGGLPGRPHEPLASRSSTLFLGNSGWAKERIHLALDGVRWTGMEVTGSNGFPVSLSLVDASCFLSFHHAGDAFILFGVFWIKDLLNSRSWKEISFDLFRVSTWANVGRFYMNIEKLG